MGDTEAHSRNWTSMKIVKQRSVKIDLFLSAIELSVVLFTASDYPFDTLKLFYIKANAKRFNNQIKKKWAFSLNIIEHAGIMNTWWENMSTHWSLQSRNNYVWQTFYTTWQHLSLFLVDDLIKYLSHKLLHIAGIIPYMSSLPGFVQK